jgi:hypothetical protein
VTAGAAAGAADGAGDGCGDAGAGAGAGDSGPAAATATGGGAGGCGATSFLTSSKGDPYAAGPSGVRHVVACRSRSTSRTVCVHLIITPHSVESTIDLGSHPFRSAFISHIKFDRGPSFDSS